MNCAINLDSCGPTVAHWRTRSGYWFPLCLTCLNSWFDSADDDPDLEPVTWKWLTGAAS